jgi:hypothetical protein
LGEEGSVPVEIFHSEPVNEPLKKLHEFSTGIGSSTKPHNIAV